MPDSKQTFNQPGTTMTPDLSDKKQEEKRTTLVDRRTYDCFLLCAIIVMLSWPWLFWGVVRHVNGIQMGDHLAQVVRDHPHSTTFFASLVGTLVCLVVNILFSLSILRFTQEWVVTSSNVTVFDVTWISAFRHQAWPWRVQEWKSIANRPNALKMFLVVFCIATFAFVPPGPTSLLAPTPFNKTVPLTATELDFSFTNTRCVAFLQAHNLSNNCDWQFYKGTPYTNCLGENQMVDVLEAGRSNILSLLPNNSESLALSQLGNKDGMRLLGPLRGVLPSGPDGAHDFNTLQRSPFSTDPQAIAAIISYNYTLEQQGLDSNVTCNYDMQSPITLGRAPDGGNWVFQYNGTCPTGQVEFLSNQNLTTFVSTNSDNSLAYWACKSPPDSKEQTYYVYLRGRQNYQDFIGNMTCIISPVRPAVFPATFRSKSGLWSLGNSVSTTPGTFPNMIERGLVGAGGIIQQSQNSQANLVAESVITFAVKSFGILVPYNRSTEYLRLFAAMIQGMLEYEATYIRLLYSTIADPDPSCIRTVKGEATFEVVGWSAELNHIGFLMPMTLINLTSLVLISIVLVMATGEADVADPLETRALLAADRSEGQPDWKDKIKFQRRREDVGEAGDRSLGGCLGAIVACFTSD